MRNFWVGVILRIEAFLNNGEKMKFRNPSNGYTEKVSSVAWLWVLLFGTIYFIIKGVWTHALVSFIFALLTAGISWLIYPFFASSIMRRHYLKKGWIEVSI
ncbi:hypothetical protein [Thiospirillum jenense]|uniref:Uncharacterized protein n=1 Tax=Thiospirillum jenense TaxID=1653858 RepID=A0A839HLV4_9GAMM|nr:hypothetical protein [Thiospirillum jenense]MBB1127249.1 hypothetical protein [Thiospirillum jenense]